MVKKAIISKGFNVGGDRESFVAAKTEKTNNKEVVLVESKIRFHESNGEVHFHDDKNGLKVAIKVPIWHTAWESLKTKVGKVGDLDKEQAILGDCQGGKTELIVEVSCDDDDKIDASLTIREVASLAKPKMGSIFAALEGFTNP